MIALSAEADALLKQGMLCTESALPKDYLTLNNLLWQAFENGKQYGTGKVVSKKEVDVKKLTQEHNANVVDMTLKAMGINQEGGKNA